MLRKVNDPLREGCVLYSRLVEERIKRVLGGRIAGLERWPFDAIDAVMSKPRTNVRREDRRKRAGRIMAEELVMMARRWKQQPIKPVIGSTAITESHRIDPESYNPLKYYPKHIHKMYPDYPFTP